MKSETISILNCMHPNMTFTVIHLMLCRMIGHSARCSWVLYSKPTTSAIELSSDRCAVYRDAIMLTIVRFEMSTERTHIRIIWQTDSCCPSIVIAYPNCRAVSLYQSTALYIDL